LLGLLERIRCLLKCHVLLLPRHGLALVGFLETESGGAGVITMERKETALTIQSEPGSRA
jgi:hypothetical protein